MEAPPAASDPIRSVERIPLHGDAHYVDSDEFLRLLVSSRHFERVDQPGAGLLGLVDRETGEHYLIEASRIPAQGAPPAAPGSPPAAS